MTSTPSSPAPERTRTLHYHTGVRAISECRTTFSIVRCACLPPALATTELAVRVRPRPPACTRRARACRAQCTARRAGSEPVTTGGVQSYVVDLTAAKCDTRSPRGASGRYEQKRRAAFRTGHTVHQPSRLRLTRSGNARGSWGWRGSGTSAWRPESGVPRSRSARASAARTVVMPDVRMRHRAKTNERRTRCQRTRNGGSRLDGPPPRTAREATAHRHRASARRRNLHRA